jgi:hypothetical protein
VAAAIGRIEAAVVAVGGACSIRDPPAALSE